jgi:hypothetical protein
VVPPAPETIAAFPETFLDYFRVRIDPAQSGDTDSVPRFGIPNGASAGLHVRRAVAEFIEDPAACPRDADIVLKLSPEAWAKAYLSAEPVDELVEAGDISVTGDDAAEAVRVLDQIDRYDPERAVVVPPRLWCRVTGSPAALAPQGTRGRIGSSQTGTRTTRSASPPTRPKACRSRAGCRCVAATRAVS